VRRQAANKPRADKGRPSTAQLIGAAEAKHAEWTDTRGDWVAGRGIWNKRAAGGRYVASMNSRYWRKRTAEACRYGVGKGEGERRRVKLGGRRGERREERR
jgi:hypothetical protein